MFGKPTRADEASQIEREFRKLIEETMVAEVGGYHSFAREENKTSCMHCGREYLHPAHLKH